MIRFRLDVRYREEASLLDTDLRNRKKMIRVASALVAISSLAACTTTLQVRKVTPATPAPAVGWVYSLPYTRFEVTVTRTFKGCLNGATAPTYYYGITPIAATHPDPAHTYTVGYDSLSSALKTSNIN